jgi:predicted amidohydrolase YtcJ
LTKKTLTLDEALRAMTVGAAYALRREDEVGTLHLGKYADLVILSTDPRDAAPETLKDIQVLMTMVGGKVEYCAAGQSALCPSGQ